MATGKDEVAQVIGFLGGPLFPLISPMLLEPVLLVGNQVLLGYNIKDGRIIPKRTLHNSPFSIIF